MIAAGMSKPMHVMICGQVRHDEMFRAAIARFQTFRANGTIDRIVFSTWAGEIDRYKGLRVDLATASVELVEAIMPVNHMEGSGNFFYQATQAVNGLERFAPDDAVFKTRGDVRINFALDFTACKTHWEQHDRENPIVGEHLQHRIAVGNAVRFTPFWLEDRYFYGICKDLRTLIRVSRAGDILWNPQTAIAEVRLFGTSFTETFPVVRHMLRIFWMLYFHPHDPVVYKADVVYRSIAVYHFILDTFFTLGLDRSWVDLSAFENTIEPPPIARDAPEDAVTAGYCVQLAYVETRRSLAEEGTAYLQRLDVIAWFRDAVDKLGRDTINIYGDFVQPAGA